MTAATRTLAVLVALAVAGCAGPGEPSTTPAAPSESATPVATPAPASATPTAAPTRADELELLVERLEAVHPEPFLGTTRETFLARVEDLAARADDLATDAYLVELMRLFADRDRDGHSGVIPFAQADELISAWPVALYEFTEGTYVVAARAPYEDLVGGRVTRVAGRPLEEVRELVAPLVSHDNAATVAARLPGYLVVPEVLRGLGLLADGAPGLTVETAAGESIDVTPEPIPMSEFRTWRGLFDPLVPPSLPPDEDGPLTLRNRAERFWLEDIGDTLYVGYHQVQSTSASNESITPFVERIRATLEDGSVERVVLDVRHNPGGENRMAGPLRDALREQATSDPGSVGVLIGRSTFSAAGILIAELRDVDGIRFIGEPSGSSPNLYGDATIVELPASGLRVHVATRWWETSPGDPALSIEPDAPVPVRWRDYAAGTDAALDVALSE